MSDRLVERVLFLALFFTTGSIYGILLLSGNLLDTMVPFAVGAMLFCFFAIVTPLSIIIMKTLFELDVFTKMGLVDDTLLTLSDLIEYGKDGTI